MNGTIISGGSTIVNVTSSRALDRLYVQFAGINGYYEVAILPADLVSSAGGTYIYNVLLQLAQNLLQSNGQIQISFSGSEGAGASETVSPSVSSSVQARVVGGLGKAMQISISWDTRYDLDLYVTPPVGQTIYYGRKRVGNGYLDLDANVGCGDAGSSWDIRNENIYFDAPLADGDYVVEVDRYSTCSPTTITNYSVSAYINGNLFGFSNSQVGQFAASSGRKRNAVGTIRITGGVASQVNGGVVVPDDREIAYGARVEYEGETYETVRIGAQTWMASNLNYNATGSKCYNNNNDNCAIYGRLYDWATAMGLASTCNTSECEIGETRKGICPTGWHIPTNAEWNTLTTTISTNAGTKLKSRIGWNDDGNGTDIYGFAALPGGSGNSLDNEFGSVGGSGYWWSSSEYGETHLYAYHNNMNSSANNVSSGEAGKTNLYSVRCLKN